METSTCKRIAAEMQPFGDAIKCKNKIQQYTNNPFYPGAEPCILRMRDLIKIVQLMRRTPHSEDLGRDDKVS